MSEVKSLSKGRLWGEAIALVIIFFVALIVASIIGVIVFMAYLASQGQTLDPGDLNTASKATFLFLPLATLMVLGATYFFLKKRGVGWGDIGLRKPKSLLKTLLLSIAIFFAAFFTSVLVNLGMTALGFEQDLTTFDFLYGDFFMYIYLITVISWFSAGFAEEVVFRGFIMGSIAKALGDSKRAWMWAALVQASFFGLLHAYQGLNGIVATATIAFVFGLSYFYIRSLWPIIIAHALVDIFGISMLYYAVDIPL